MGTFFKGIIVGLGAIAPGLSGSILLVLFGLYQKVVDCVTHFFSDIKKTFKKNILFLLPLALGIGIGVLLFAKLISYLLTKYPMQTNYAFLGLILGSVPMLWCEVRKRGFKPFYFAFMGGAFALGVLFFVLNRSRFDDVADPSFFQSVLLGFAVSAAYLIPGVDSAAILSSFGLYNLWLSALETLNFAVLLPAAIGFIIGAILISILFSRLLSRFYTGTYAVIFGLFMSVILNFIFKECPPPALDARSIVSILFLVSGFAFSFAFAHLEDIRAYVINRRRKASASDDASSDAEERICGERQSDSDAGNMVGNTPSDPYSDSDDQPKGV